MATQPQSINHDIQSRNKANIEKTVLQEAEVKRLKNSAKRNKKMRTEYEAAWKNMLYAFSISKKDIRNVRLQGVYRSFVNMFYLLVIVGCELDLYGFSMAYATYWTMGYTIVNILLILGPIGYILAVFMYMYPETMGIRKKDETEESKNSPDYDSEFRKELKNFSDAEGCPVQLQQGADQLEAPQEPPILVPSRSFPVLKRTREAINLRYYHFLPIVRYYLVIKDKAAEDIEGVFRVNSLSSFTLGIAQVISIVFQIFVAGQPMTIFVQINIGSQIINWLITFLYFITPISSVMTSSIEISAFTHNSKNQLREISSAYMKAASRGAVQGNLLDAEAIQQVVDREIAFLGNSPNEDLSAYTMDQKFRALMLLRERELNRLSKI